MDEKVILRLISHSVRQVLRENGSGWNEVDEARICEHLADVAWTALIVGAREALSRGDSVVLDEFGRFDIVDGSWHFIAAESLQEAKAISMKPSAGYAFLAQQALDSLSLAARLAKHVPKKFRVRQDVDDRAVTPEEKLLQAIFGESGEEQKFGEVLRQRALVLAKYFDASDAEEPELGRRAPDSDLPLRESDPGLPLGA